MPKFLIQTIPNEVPSVEVRTVLQHCMLHDFHYERSTIDALDSIDPMHWVSYDDVTPVGSVEFVQKFYQLLTLREPLEFDCYPESMHHHLNRDFVEITLKDAFRLRFTDKFFLKPAKKIKAFTGSVFAPSEPTQEIASLLDSDPCLECYMVEPVEFLAEYRVYFVEGHMAGISRYDDRDTEHTMTYEILEQIAEMGRDCRTDISTIAGTFAMDVGFIGDKLSLVEVNDFWAIGLYLDKESILPMNVSSYVLGLTSRWFEIVNYD